MMRSLTVAWNQLVLTEAPQWVDVPKGVLEGTLCLRAVLNCRGDVPARAALLLLEFASPVEASALAGTGMLCTKEGTAWLPLTTHAGHAVTTVTFVIPPQLEVRRIGVHAVQGSGALRVESLWFDPSVSTGRHFVIKADDFRLNESTEKFLRLFDLCEEFNVPLCIGVIGNGIRDGRYSDRVRVTRMCQRGVLELWNHSLTHRNLQPVAPRQLEQEIAETNSACLQQFGVAPTGFGAPFNKSSEEIHQIAKKLGLAYVYEELFERGVMFTPENNVPFDGHPSFNVFLGAAQSRQNLPALIIQIHPGRWIPRGYEEFRLILQWLSANGYQGATLSSLLPILQPGSPAPAAHLHGLHSSLVADLASFWDARSAEYLPQLSNFTSYFLTRFVGNAVGIKAQLEKLGADINVRRVADVGCGLAQWSLPFMEFDSACQVYAFDINGTIAQAMRNAKDEGILPERFYFYHEDYTQTNVLSPCSLDRVLCANALNYISVPQFAKHSWDLCRESGLVILENQTSAFNYLGFRTAEAAGNLGMAKERAMAELQQHLVREGFAALQPPRTTLTMQELEALFYIHGFKCYDDFVSSFQVLEDGEPTFQGMVFRKDSTLNALKLPQEYRVALRRLLCRAGHPEIDEQLFVDFGADLADPGLKQLKVRGLGSGFTGASKRHVDCKLADALLKKDYAAAIKLASAGDQKAVGHLLAFVCAMLADAADAAAAAVERLAPYRDEDRVYGLALALHRALTGKPAGGTPPPGVPASVPEVAPAAVALSSEWELQASAKMTGSLIEARISPVEGGHYLFYVMRNGQKVFTQPYSAVQNTLCHDVGGQPGQYAVEAYLANADSSRTPRYKRMNVGFVFGNPVSVEDVFVGNLDGPLYIRGEHFTFHTVFHRSEERRLFVLLSGASPREKDPIPSFHRWNWMDRFPGSMLSISDPTWEISPDLFAGWYLGTAEHDASAEIAALVRAFAEMMEIPLASVVFYGSSAGGFAALMLSSLLPDSLGVAINPQTLVTRFHKPEAVEALLRHCFNAMPREEVLARYAARLSVLEAQRRNPSRFIIMQNTEDSTHYGEHFLPLMEGLGLKPQSGMAEDGRRGLLVYAHESGHGVEPEEHQPELFRMIVEMTPDGGDDDTPESYTPDPTFVVTGSKALPADCLAAQAALQDDEVLRTVLSSPLDMIGQDFSPTENLVLQPNGSAIVTLPFTNAPITIAADCTVDWLQSFDSQAGTNTLFFYSLQWIGHWLSVYEDRGLEDYFTRSTAVLKNYFVFLHARNHEAMLMKMRAADHCVAIRIAVFTKYLNASVRAKQTDYELQRAIIKDLIILAEWICDNRNYRESNHGVMGSLALLHVAIQVKYFESLSARYVDCACRRIVEQVRKTFDSDGFCNENTIGYHRFNMSLYDSILQFSSHYGIVEHLVKTLAPILEKAATALKLAVWQDGSIPPIGDSPVYTNVSQSINRSFWFRESGFLVIKNEDLYLSLTCGSSGWVHKQCDDSSITLRYKGHDLIIDAGHYTHDHQDPYRMALAGQRGHSGIFLEQCDNVLREAFVQQFSPFEANIVSFEEDEAGARAVCRYEILGGACRVEREVQVFWPDEVLIRDRVSVHGDTATTARQRFILAPSVHLEAAGGQLNSLRGDGIEATLFHLSPSVLDAYSAEEPPQTRGWYSVNYAELLPTSGLDFVQSGTELFFVTAIKLAVVEGMEQLSPALQRALTTGIEVAQ